MEKGKVKNLIFKNSIFSLLSVIVGKLGGLIFTVLIARLLLPELFGIYNLVLSIVLIAITFTDMGINGAALRYFSKTLGKKNFSKLRGYFSYLFKLKISISLTIIAILLALTKYLAFTVFEKPEIVLPLVLSGFYIIFISVKDLFLTMIYALKEVNKTPLIEMSNQFTKIVLSFLAITYLSDEWKLAGLFLGFALAILASIITTFFFLRKRKYLFLGPREPILKRKLVTYISLLGITGFSLAFFASVDTLMLGKFLDAEYIGIYRAGLSLILTISSLFAFSNVLLPVFTQLKKTSFSETSKDISRYLLILSIPATLGIVSVAQGVITIVFGMDYFQAYKIVSIMAPLIIIFPFVSFYSSLYQAKGKIKSLAICTIVALIANIALNYYLIKGLLKFGQIYSTMGAGIATILSWAILLILLVFSADDSLRIKVKKVSLFKISLSSIAMFAVIFNLKKFISESSILGNSILVILGIITYAALLFMLKELTIEDLDLIRNSGKN